jgi:hypothetical protein
MDLKQQRKLGMILAQLEEVDRLALLTYIETLETQLEEPKKLFKKVNNEAIETSALESTTKPYGSKFFSEEEIHNEMFRVNQNKVFINESNIKYHLTSISQLLNLQEPIYKELRKKAIINLHNSRYAIQNNA